MQTILDGQRYVPQSYAARVWITMLVLTLCLGATVAYAAPPASPAVVVSQVSVIGDLNKDAFNAGKMPSGGSFAVTTNGYIVVGTAWGNEVDIFNIASPGAPTVFPVSNVSGITSDRQNNLFMGAMYKHKFYKLPYVNGSWVTTIDLDNAPNCTGADTVACGMTANVGTDYNSNLDFKNFVFDAAGNLFLVTATDNVNGGNAIYKLAAADLYTGRPTLVYTDDATHAIASIAVDPWGNLFFTDVVYADQGNQNATISSVNVLPYSSSAGYATSKTVLVTFTNPTPGNYDNVLSGVGVDPANGTVYYSDNNGTYAFPNTPANPADAAHAYLVTTTGGYQVTPDSKGNLYSVAWDSAGGKRGVFQILLNNIFVPASAVGVESQATNVKTVVNGVDCTGTLTFTLLGGNTTTASAAAAGGCVTRSLGDVAVSGAGYDTTVSLTPAAGGTSVVTLAASDAASHAGMFTITGGTLVGRRPIVTTQVSVIGDLNKDAFNAGKMPSGGSFAVTTNGYIVVGTAWGNEVDIFNIASPGAPTVFPVSNIAGITSDRQNNLYFGALYKHKYYKLPYLGGGTWVTTVDLDNVPNCTGTDTVACGMPNVAGGDYNNNLDFKNLVFDAAGNLFLVTATDNIHGGNAIYRLAAADLYTGVPVLVYTDDIDHAIASITVDPWGNLFFTDVVYADQGNQNATISSVNVLPYSSSAGYATSKTVLVTFTNPTPGNYDNVLSGVGVDPASGTVFYSDNNQTFAFANNPVTPADVAHAYLASSTGGYQVTPDSKGNLYSVAWDSAGGKRGVFQILIDNVVVPAARIGTPSQVTNVTTASSGVDCSGTVTFVFTNGNDTTTGSADPSAGTCAAKSLGDVPATGVTWTPTTVIFFPGIIGLNTALLTATDSANNTGTLTITGEGLASGSTPQTITFDNPGTQSAATPLTLSATASSGLPVSFLSTTTSVCSVSGNTATFLRAGTCTIIATQSGDNTYAAATRVTQSFTVNLTAQTITFANPGDQTMATGSLTLSATASSGLPVSLRSTTTAVCTLAGTRVTFVALGTCTLEASQAGTNLYAAAPTVTQSFEIIAAQTQTITFNNPGTRMVGYPLTLVATATSGLPVRFASTTASVCTVSGTRATFVAAGTCTIEASQPGDNNYSAAPTVPQSFAVIVVTAQTITFEDPGAQRVGAPATLSATATSGMPVTFTSTTPTVCTISGATATFVAAGTCTVEASQPGDGATVGPAPVVSLNITVNANSWAPFTLGTPSMTSLTVREGETSSAVMINVNAADGAKGLVSFSCSGLPAGATCNFYPRSITLPSDTWTMVTISTTTATAAAGTGTLPLYSNPLLPMATLALIGCCFIGSDKRRVRSYLLLAAVVIGLVLLIGCGASPKPTESTVTVHAVKGTVEQTTNITLNVTK